MPEVNVHTPYPTDDELEKYGLPLIRVPTKLVIHAIGEYIGGEGWKHHAVQHLNREKLSAHLVIGPDGKKYKCRDYNRIAWHAKGHNTNSIGIEVCVKGVFMAYQPFLDAMKEDWITNMQYGVLVGECIDIIKEYPITEVVRHSDIDPKRKQDPGEGFPWDKFLNDIGMS